MTNRVFAVKDVAFIKACESANTKPTKRQASKFRHKKGIAYKKRGASPDSLKEFLTL